jgi:hypothetical protein
VKEGVKKIYTLTESERIQSVLLAHTEQEESITTESLLNEGCIEPLVVWKGVLIDGYLRYHICHEHGIPFEVVEMDFSDETEAILWVIQTHIGRRNLSTFQKCEIVLLFEPELRAEAKKRQGWRSDLKGMEDHQFGRTVSYLANMAGVSTGTLHHAKYIVDNGDQETIRRLRNGEISVYRGYSSLREKPPRPPKESIGARGVMIDIRPIKTAVINLINQVSDGEATPKAIIAELNRINVMIEEATT